jgi:hypothetical protein
MFPPRLTGIVHRGRVELHAPDVLALVPLTDDIVYLNRAWRLELDRPQGRRQTRECPICRQPDGRHWTVPHAWMPRADQERRLRWFTAEESEAWLRRHLDGLHINEEGDR